MDIAALASELTNDPLAVGYAAMSDYEAATSLNSPTRTGYQPVPSTEVRLYVLLNGIWPMLQSVASTSTDPVHRGTAITILQTLSPNSFDTIRMQRPDVRAGVATMLQTMVDAGAMTAQHRSDMLAMGDATVSRAEELGLGTVNHVQVAEARSLPQA